MLNKYPLWKNLLIALIVAISALLALPNIFNEYPSVQIAPTRTTTVDAALLTRVNKILSEAKIDSRSSDLIEERLLIRFHDTETQLKAKDLIGQALGKNYNIALNLSPDMPAWLETLGLSRMYLGLDLRGGVHFLMEIDIPSLLAQLIESYSDDLKKLATENQLDHVNINIQNGDTITVSAPDAQAANAFHKLVQNNTAFLDLEWRQEGNTWLAKLSDTAINERRVNALAQNITTLRNRVNELGVAEPVIQQQGTNRIVVQLPGIQDTARAKEILGATATLEFRMVDERSNTQAVSAAQNNRAPLGSKLYFMRDTNQPVLLKRQVMLTGESVINAQASISQTNGLPQVEVTLDTKGAERFATVTKQNIGKPMATVFIEKRPDTEIKNGEEVRTYITTEEIANVATIQSQLFKNFVITGLDSFSEANNLAILLRSGSLAAPMQIVEERTVGPSAGKENITKGFNASLYALILVMGFMLMRYRAFGMVANVALFINLVMIIALLSVLQATLTLPGIAGIVLSLGMSVDANVLIYERIREDLRRGLSPQNAIHEGFEKAIGTITDANLTSLVAALVLFGIGSGPIKGFAVTLTLGILTSMFTAIMVARAIVNFVWGGKKLQSLSIGSKELLPFLKGDTNFNFMGGRKFYIALCFIMMIAATGLTVLKGFNFGLDFTGGTVLKVAYKDSVEIDAVKSALSMANIESAQVQHFGSSSEVLIRLPLKTGAETANLSSQVLSALQQNGETVEIQSVEFVGPQVGQELVTDGTIASLVAIVLILIYIWVRFEWKLALGTILSTLHDTVLVIALFSLLGLEFDLTALAAILAVIGYSVNDTVVVIDRIRENFRNSRQTDALLVANQAINQTLSRTIMTSMTTFLAVFALYWFGGSTVESFSLAMLVGVVIGTYSSIFIASAFSVLIGLQREDLLIPSKNEDGQEQVP